jgi:hypothetical protein
MSILPPCSGLKWCIYPSIPPPPSGLRQPLNVVCDVTDAEMCAYAPGGEVGGTDDYVHVLEVQGHGVSVKLLSSFDKNRRPLTSECGMCDPTAVPGWMRLRK